VGGNCRHRLASVRRALGRHGDHTGSPFILWTHHCLCGGAPDVLLLLMKPDELVELEESVVENQAAYEATSPGSSGRCLPPGVCEHADPTGKIQWCRADGLAHRTALDASFLGKPRRTDSTLLPWSWHHQAE
jgi:hypothetical protein